MGIPPLRLRRIERVSSTQEEARRLVRAGERPGIVVLAEEQSAGRGRGGAPWDSRRGLGLWLTVVHASGRPAVEWPALTSVAALAVCAAAEDLRLAPRIKWPNDCLLDGRKFAGVLAETEGSVLLLGIGVNLLHSPQDFPADLAPRATSIGRELGRTGREPASRERFLGILLGTVRAELERFEEAGPAAALAEVWSRSSVRGRWVRAGAPEAAPVEGRAVGLGPVGELLIETGTGVVRVSGGAVRLREGT